MLTLLAISLALRVAGSCLRSAAHPVALIPGWGLALLATWGAGGAAGIALPLWTVLPVAMLGALLEHREEQPWWMLAGDAVLLLLMATTAVPPPEWRTLATVVGGVTLTWSAVEFGVRTLPPLVRPLVLAGAVGATMLFAARTSLTPDPLAPTLRVASHLTVAPRCEGERITLDNGSVGWFHTPRSSGPYPGALLFHGAHPLGSRQPAQCSLIRALLDQEYAVLAVDHPGYGESPHPNAEAAIEAWDYLPTYRMAHDRLREHPDVSEVPVVAGHSMGSVGAIRLLSERPETQATFIFGAALADPPERDPYWHERFHTDRNLPFEVAFDTWKQIRDRYYSFAHAAEAMPENHGHVVFVEFDWEWENLETVRDVQYDRIPGSKERWTMEGSSHYFSVLTWHGLLAADGRVMRDLSRGIGARVEGAPEG